MSVHDFLISHAVKVNEGSGVLVQSMSDDYSYVLTAKHVLKEDDKLFLWDGTPVKSLGAYFLNEDCALIKVPVVEGLALTRFRNSNIDYQAQAVFAGFPGYLSNEKTPIEKFRVYNGKLSSVADDYLLTIDNLPNRGLIEGASGGGVYLLVNQRPFLVAVEIEMAGPQPKEPGVVKCCKLSRFDEIISVNGFAPILPTFFECFRKIQNRTFQFDSAIPGSFNNLRSVLHSKVAEMIAAGVPKPYQLLDKYKNDLIVVGQSHQAVYDIDLWTAYAEFLVLDMIMSESDNFSVARLQEIERSRRIVYSRNENNWLQDFSNILQSARKLLDDGGMLIVASKDNASAPVPCPIMINAILENITVPLSEDEDEDPRIDVGIETGCPPYNFALLGSLQQTCIIKNEIRFRKAPPDQLIDILRGYYGAVVKWK